MWRRSREVRMLANGSTLWPGGWVLALRCIRSSQCCPTPCATHPTQFPGFTLLSKVAFHCTPVLRVATCSCVALLSSLLFAGNTVVFANVPPPVFSRPPCCVSHHPSQTRPKEAQPTQNHASAANDMPRRTLPSQALQSVARSRSFLFANDV